jgi:hypothetical protein
MISMATSREDECSSMRLDRCICVLDDGLHSSLATAGATLMKKLAACEVRSTAPGEIQGQNSVLRIS